MLQLYCLKGKEQIKNMLSAYCYERNIKEV